MFHSSVMLQLRKNIEKPCNLLKSVNLKVASFMKSLKSGYYPLETTFSHKTLNLFNVLNIQISWRTIIESQTNFNANRAKNVVPIWIFCIFNESNEKKKNGVNFLYPGIIWSFQKEIPYTLLWKTFYLKWILTVQQQIWFIVITARVNLNWLSIFTIFKDWQMRRKKKPWGFGQMLPMEKVK